MPINHWPTEDRPREKLLQQGEKTLTDAELIAIFIKTGIAGKSALDIARELLQQHGNLHQLSQADSQLIMQMRGMGKAKYAALKAAIELGRRSLLARPHVGEKLASSGAALDFLSHHLRYRLNEAFACIFLDQHLHFLGFEVLAEGTIHEASIYPREIIRRSLIYNAARLILAHNHPSGQHLPSEADKTVTEMLKQALSYVDIELVDHLIIGNPGHFSFADSGLLSF